MTRAPRTRALVVAGALALLPRVAAACPACVGDAGNNYTFLKLGALMSLVPFAIVAMVLRVLRQAPRESAPRDEAGRAAGRTPSPNV